MNSIVIKNLDEVSVLCDRLGVEKLYAFGSVLTDSFDNDTSDIDLLVELKDMPPFERGFALLDLWDGLESLFERKVDLLSAEQLKNPYFREAVESTKQLIYDQRRQEVSL